VIAASTTREAPFPPNTESPIAGFAELVATAVSIAEARADLVASRARVLTAGDDTRRRVVRDLHDGAQQSLVLARGGLAAGVNALVRRLRVPVSVEVPRDRFPTEIEASAYFVVAEALTNVAKHSGAQSADVTASIDDSVLRLDVRDDGVGGARRDGSGLVGLDDRVAALGGELRLESPPGGGTRITATLPLQH
jgi:signal transduction histidine kinase